MLINIIGCDGSGKSTAIDYCATWIEKNFQLDVHTLNKWQVFDHGLFPECSFLKCSEDELKNCISQMNGESRFLFLLYLYTTTILKIDYKNDNTIIFIDGFWQKHFAVEKLLGIDEGWMKEACRFLPEPDLTILLDVDPNNSIKRKSKISQYECGGVKNFCNEDFLRHQKKLRNELLQLAKEENWHIIDANGDLANVLNTIWNVIHDFLKIKIDSKEKNNEYITR